MISLRRLRFWWKEPRIGSDIPLKHWMLQFPGLRRWLAERKLARFGAGRGLRPFCKLERTDRIEIGERVGIRPQTIIMPNGIARIIIGNDVLIAVQGHSLAEHMVIEDDVWISAAAIILPVSALASIRSLQRAAW